VFGDFFKHYDKNFSEHCKKYYYVLSIAMIPAVRCNLNMCQSSKQQFKNLDFFHLISKPSISMPIFCFRFRLLIKKYVLCRNNREFVIFLHFSANTFDLIQNVKVKRLREKAFSIIQLFFFRFLKIFLCRNSILLARELLEFLFTQQALIIPLT